MGGFFQSSLVVLGARRGVMNSKMGNKEYYKGTGSFPGLGPKRQGKHSPRSKAPYILMAERMRTFVVPEGLNASNLKPYVAITSTISSNDKFDWPLANTKTSKDVNSKRAGIFGPGGFDGEYYLQLAKFYQDKSAAVALKK